MYFLVRLTGDLMRKPLKSWAVSAGLSDVVAHELENVDVPVE